MPTPLPVILTTEPLDPQWLRPPHVPEGLEVVERLVHRPAEIEADLWRQVEVLSTGGLFPEPEQAPRLRWIQLHSAGANQLAGARIAQPPVQVTTASGVHAVPIAEFVLGGVLGLLHHLPRMVRYQDQHFWPVVDKHALLMPRELWGATLGIAGYGSIGRQTARLARGLGMRVLAMQRGEDHRDRGFSFPGVGDPEGTLPERYFLPGQFHEMLSLSDVVLAALPLTPATERLFDAGAFAAMRPGSIFVNIARGAICAEGALTQALASGHLGGALLDVFEQEPLPADSPLWSFPQALITPHISGSNPHYASRVSQILVENLRRYLSGEPLLNVVDFHHGY
jgi:phosphoglycerate dehydrogenase-like enzyme